MKRFAILLLMALTLATGSREAHAMSRQVRGLLTLGEYGLVGGTIIGLAAYPLTGEGRSIFIGSSVGLYVGLVFGLGYVLSSNGDEDPFWARRSKWESSSLEMPGVSQREAAWVGKPIFEMRWQVGSF